MKKDRMALNLYSLEIKAIVNQNDKLAINRLKVRPKLWV